MQKLLCEESSVPFLFKVGHSTVVSLAGYTNHISAKAVNKYVTAFISQACPSYAPDYSDQRTCRSRACLISGVYSLILLPWELKYDKEGKAHDPQS